jgi:hypothetical protein
MTLRECGVTTGAFIGRLRADPVAVITSRLRIEAEA